MSYNGLGTGMGNLSRLSDASTRSVSPENFTGEKGNGARAVEGTGAECARELGQGWKISPSVRIPGKSTAVMADIEGPGAIQHIWLTCPHTDFRSLIIRFYWDGEETPSVEVPVGDFFCQGWCEKANLSSLAVCVNPSGGLNCYWEMPFRRRARITMENLAEAESVLYYQVTYCLTEVPEDSAYFHAQFRRDNPLKYKEVHTVLDNVSGKGHYVGTYLAWGVNNSNWWGEGEIKFYMDGDTEYPTICGTGTEDYIGGAWNFEFPSGQYGIFSTPYSGLHQVIKPDGLYRSQQRFGMYRWHITDPIRFEKDLKVTIQALGWRSGMRYLPLQDDIASVGYWYQTEPHAAFPGLGAANDLEVI